MTWIGTRVLREDNQQGTVIDEKGVWSEKLIIHLDDGTKDTAQLWPWAVPTPNKFFYLAEGEGKWVNLNGHEHGVKDV